MDELQDSQAQQSTPAAPQPAQPITQEPVPTLVPHVKHVPSHKQEPVVREEKPPFMTRMRSLMLEYLRVLRVTKKPNKLEFREILKISGLGILVIGFIGYIITLAKELILKAV